MIKIQRFRWMKEEDYNALPLNKRDPHTRYTILDDNFSKILYEVLNNQVLDVFNPSDTELNQKITNKLDEFTYTKQVIDNKDLTNLTKSKQYTDTEIITALTSSKQYTDTAANKAETNSKNYTDTKTSTKLEKVWTDVVNQTVVNLDDIFVLNRGNATYKTTLANMLSHVALVDLFTIVAVLPEKGAINKIYLVPSSDPQLQNTYSEYIWINNNWEMIGNVSINLENYFTKTEINQLFTSLREDMVLDINTKLLEYYKKTEIDQMNEVLETSINTKLDSSQFTREGIEWLLSDKNTVASTRSIILGTGANSLGDKSISIGNKSVSNDWGVAIGEQSYASYLSIAQGFNSQAPGTNTIAIGINSESQGTYGISLGYNAKVIGVDSIAIGRGAVANNDYEVVIGNDHHNSIKLGDKPIALVEDLDPIYDLIGNMDLILNKILDI